MGSVMAQENVKVSGQITDNKGEAIIGASVKVLKTGLGTISDMDGKFTRGCVKTLAQPFFYVLQSCYIFFCL